MTDLLSNASPRFKARITGVVNEQRWNERSRSLRIRNGLQSTAHGGDDSVGPLDNVMRTFPQNRDPRILCRLVQHIG
jgi:hypothetical protein